MGASMYLLGIHWQAMKFCLLNPKWVKKTSLKNPTGKYGKAFNKWQKAKGEELKGYIEVTHQELLEMVSSSVSSADPLANAASESMALQVSESEESSSDEGEVSA